MEEAKHFLFVGIERGKMSPIERDLVLEKLRKSYEMLIFERKAEVKKTALVQDISHGTNRIEVEKTPEIPKPTRAPEVSTEHLKQEIAKLIVHEAVSDEIELDETSPEQESISSKEDDIEPKTIIEVGHDETEDMIQLKSHSPVLGEKYQGKMKFRNETLATGKKDIASELQNKPIQDLTKAIGINDKFLFTKELFSGNAELYAKTMRKLNEFSDINDALIFVQENFNWDDKNEAANQLIDLVRRKLMMD